MPVIRQLDAFADYYEKLWQSKTYSAETLSKFGTLMQNLNVDSERPIYCKSTNGILNEARDLYFSILNQCTENPSKYFRGIDYDAFEAIKLNFSKNAEEAENAFRNYCRIVRESELKTRILRTEERIYCDDFTRNHNNQTLHASDKTRTKSHNIAISCINELNVLAQKLGFDWFIIGSVSESKKDRSELAKAIFEFCEQQA